MLTSLSHEPVTSS